MNRALSSSTGIVFALTLLIVGMGCKKTDLPDRDPDLHRQAGWALCRKMITCLRPYTRTIHEEYRRTITEDACIESLDEFIKAKQSWNPAETAMARSCYQKELQADCRNFLTMPITDPDCLQLTLAQNGLSTVPQKR